MYIPGNLYRTVDYSNKTLLFHSIGPATHSTLGVHIYSQNCLVESVHTYYITVKIVW